MSNVMTIYFSAGMTRSGRLLNGIIIPSALSCWNDNSRKFL